MNYSIGQLLKAKGKNVWSITPQATAYEALQIMSEKDVGALLVIDKGKLVGIFSERDYARKVILKGKSSKNTSVDELMSRELFNMEPRNTIIECMELMTNKHIRHVPIIEYEKLVGIVTIGDVVNEIILNQDYIIKNLEQYISLGY